MIEHMFLNGEIPPTKWNTQFHSHILHVSFIHSPHQIYRHADAVTYFLFSNNSCKQYSRKCNETQLNNETTSVWPNFNIVLLIYILHLVIFECLISISMLNQELVFPNFYFDTIPFILTEIFKIRTNHLRNTCIINGKSSELETNAFLSL